MIGLQKGWVLTHIPLGQCFITKNIFSNIVMYPSQGLEVYNSKCMKLGPEVNFEKQKLTKRGKIV